MRGAGGGGTRGGAEARRGADGPGRLEGLAGPVPRRVLGARPVVARVTMVVFIRMTEVENLTTGADVRAKGIPRIALVFVFVLFALILAFMIWGAVQMFSTG
ncbi:hypothetical protein [Streptomyces sp. MMS24-I29]|uniref:hypothetical protein n=2 Tax=unclassified Streptomyces TaxID=2593676 RepID=UPI003C7C320F